VVCLKGKDVKPQVNYKEADRITRPQSRVSKPAQGPQLLVYRDREGSVKGTSLRVLPGLSITKLLSQACSRDTACDKAVQCQSRCYAVQASCHYVKGDPGRPHLDPIKVS
jgi:hypothetical protein